MTSENIPSAALEDAEGHALVKAILDRKRLRDHYASIPAPTYDPFKATKEKLAQLRKEMREAGRKRQELEQMAAHWAAAGDSGYRWVFTSGRGHGKVNAARAVLAWRKKVSVAAPPAPGVGNVRWSAA